MSLTLSEFLKLWDFFFQNLGLFRDFGIFPGTLGLFSGILLGTFFLSRPLRLSLELCDSLGLFKNFFKDKIFSSCLPLDYDVIVMSQ